MPPCDGSSFRCNVPHSPLGSGDSLWRTCAPHMAETLPASAKYRPAMCGCAGTAYVADSAKPDHETDLVTEATTKDVGSILAPPYGSHVGLARWL